MKYVKLVVEALPGLVLIAVGIVIVVAGRVSLSLLPLFTSFSVFMVASLSSKAIMRRRLSRFYNHKYFDLVSLVTFSVPLVLFLHLGYEYAHMTVSRSLEMLSSLVVGLGGYLVAYCLLRLM